MRILIISLPRTGSTSLLYKISKEREFRAIFEPFDGSNRFLYDDDMDNIVVKTIIHQHENNFELSKKFDDVILLNRKNFKNHLESYSYLYHNIRNGYHSATPYEYVAPPVETIDKSRELLIKMGQDLQELSDKLKIPIQYYEDLFDENSSERLRTDIMNKKKLI